MTITIFYSWQSDTDQKCNHYFIRDAAKDAVKALNKDYTIEDSPRDEFRLDHDTDGVPGHPAIVDTILAKIRNCQVFLADVTFVGSTKNHKAKNQRSKKTRSNAKYLPNPNVMYELGYASAVLSDRQLIMVMNTEYGSPDRRVFNVSHRRAPLKFSLDPDIGKAEKRQEHEKVRDKIKHAIQMMIADGVFEGIEAEKAKSERDRTEAFEAKRSEFHKKIKKNEFYLSLNDRPALALYIIPQSPLQEPLDWGKHYKGADHGMKPLCAAGWNNARITSSYLMNDDRTRSKEIESVVTLERNTGIIQATSIYSMTYQHGQTDKMFLRIEAIQGEIGEIVSRYLMMLQNVGVDGPWFVGMALLNLPQCNIELPGASWIDHCFMGGDIAPPLLSISTEADFSDREKTAKLMKPCFDLIWMDFNFTHCLRCP